MHRIALVCLLQLAGCAGSPVPAPAPAPSPSTASGIPLTMSMPRAAHTATSLPDGRVLVAGGCVRDGCEGTLEGGPSELFDPRTGTFLPGPPLREPRVGHTATPLPGGRVLLVGGYPDENRAPLASAEVYDPATGRFEATGAMSTGRGAHTATRLLDGRVLVVGGVGPDGYLATAEIYDPASGKFTPVAPMPGPRSTHGAVLLGDGRVLVAGGQSARDTLLDTALTFDPRADAWREVGRLDAAKYKFALAPLPDGGALVVGGQTSDAREARLTRTERFDAKSGMFTPGPTMAEPRFKISDAVVALPDGRLVIAGGVGVEAYAGGKLRRLDAAAGPERQFPAAAMLPDGGVLVTGGYDNSTRVTATAFVVHP
jgi:hypothetical protein